MSMPRKETSHIWASIVIVISLAGILLQKVLQDWTEVCYPDLTQEGSALCKPKCPQGYFAVTSMTSCHPLLKCEQITSPDFRTVEPIGSGAVKMVYLVEWSGHRLVLNELGNHDYREDFQHGLRMLRAFQGSKYVTQLVGECGDAYITEFHPLGSLDKLSNLLHGTGVLASHKTLRSMMGLCIEYVEILHFLHNSPLGVRIMCDSNDLQKTMNQYLLREDLHIVVNDLDALPEVNKSAELLAKCGRRQLHGEFVAPEQLWPFDDQIFDDECMPGYDEKTDIWKVPDVCLHFLGQAPQNDIAFFSLFAVHRKCKSTDPSERPTAHTVLNHYRELMENLNLQ